MQKGYHDKSLEGILCGEGSKKHTGKLLRYRLDRFDGGCVQPSVPLLLGG